MLSGCMAAVLAGVFGGLIWAQIQAGSGHLTLLVLAGLLVLLACLAVIASLVHLGLAKPVAALERELELQVHGQSDQPVKLPPSHALGGLPAAVARLASGSADARREFAHKTEQATASLAEEKARLAAILLDLSEGVIVCNLQHRVLLYNQAAFRLLGAPAALGLGRSLFAVFAQDAVRHCLECLRERDPGDDACRASGQTPDGVIEFLCGLVEGSELFKLRMAPVSIEGPDIIAYVLTFMDQGDRAEALAARDRLLTHVTSDWRRPLAGLRAVIETLRDHPELGATKRDALERVIAEETIFLCEGFESLAQGYERAPGRAWQLAEIHSSDLLNSLRRRLSCANGPEVTVIGLPLWFRGDSHSLLLALDRLLNRLREHTGASRFDVEPLLSDRQVYLEIVWSGSAIPGALLARWLGEPITGAAAGASLRRILDLHGSDVWSQEKRAGWAYLRLPFAVPSHLPVVRPGVVLPARPEFYDFDLFEDRQLTRAAADQPLRRLDYVVFDSETTGLRPSAGDQVIALAGVRVVNGRILTGETFNCLIDPGRPIPPASVRFHAITDEMVAGRPPFEVALPQFKEFVGDAILVAHNAAFDMTFIKRQEEASGLKFENPVLDTLLLSAVLHDHESEHGLDAVAARFGIEISGRHSALGDAMATAAVLVRMLDLLEARGIVTLAQAIEASSRMTGLRKMQARF